MERRLDARGFTLAEVLIAMAVLSIGLVALMATLSRGTVNVSLGGSQTKATEYARQQVEFLRNLPINPPCPAAGCFPVPNGTDIPEPGIARNWTITPQGATVSPNRLWRITVTVTVSQASQLAGGQTITIETRRAE